MDHLCAIKHTKFVILKMTSDSGMKCMNETSLALTLCTQLFLWDKQLIQIFLISLHSVMAKCEDQ